MVAEDGRGWRFNDSGIGATIGLVGCVGNGGILGFGVGGIRWVVVRRRKKGMMKFWRREKGLMNGEGLSNI